MHDINHESLLAEVAAGELAMDAETVVARTEACGECRELLVDMLAARASVDEAAEFRRNVLERSNDIEVPGRENRARLIRQRLRGTASGGGNPFRRYLSLAAVLVVVVAGAWLSGVFEREPETIMGGGFELSAPVGPVAKYDVFKWSYEGVVTGSYFRVVVWPEGGERFETLDPITASEWRPEPETTTAWRNIEWQVIAYLDGSEDAVSPKASAQLP